MARAQQLTVLCEADGYSSVAYESVGGITEQTLLPLVALSARQKLITLPHCPESITPGAFFSLSSSLKTHTCFPLFFVVSNHLISAQTCFAIDNTSESAKSFEVVSDF